MSETDLARSWWAGPLGGEEASGNEGRAPVTELSARDLSCSDQLKPCWSARGGILLEGALWCLVLLACGTENGGMAELARRPAPERTVATTEPWACEGLWALGLRPSDDRGEVGSLPLPGLLPGRYPLMAGAPKLMRRTKGVVGAVLVLPAGRSSSSTALSSMESELVERLPRRMLKAAGLVGEVPERPIVVTDRRRRWASAAEPGGNGGPLGLEEGPRWKRLERAAWVMELRRLPPPPGPDGEVLSEDIVDENLILLNESR